VPVVLKLAMNVPEFISAELSVVDSNVTVCGPLLQVHVIVAPTDTVSFLGEKEFPEAPTLMLVV
jgi:hypothetical protein